MTFHIITLFPEVLEPYVNTSIVGRAKKSGLIKIKLYDLKKFVAQPKRKLIKSIDLRVDDRPYGGGPGMVLRAEPLVKAFNAAVKGKLKSRTKIIIFSPAGKQFDDRTAAELSPKYSHLILIAGHYEGIDDRFKNILKDKKYSFEEISIGPYVLTGGEIAALVVVDAVSRKIKGVLGKTESLEEKRWGVGVPAYTRPEVFSYQNKKYRVPKILLSGNHARILKWRLEHKRK